MPLAEQPWRRPLYLAFLATASPLDVDILLKERVATAAVELVSERAFALMRLSPCRASGRFCEWLLLFRSVDP